MTHFIMNRNVRCVCGMFYDATELFNPETGHPVHAGHYRTYYRILHTLFKTKTISYDRYTAFLGNV
jgi:hypothetical protein